jgi:ABC-type sugar transport system substrate-binding protein
MNGGRKPLAALAVMAALLVSALLLAACGGGGSSSSSEASSTSEAPATSETSETEPSESESSPAVSAPTTEPTKLTITEPLSKKPPTGKSMVFLECELGCELYAPGVEAATKALGWNLEIIPYKQEEPQKGLQEAIQKDPDYIADTGEPVEVLEPYFKEAKEKGIELVTCAVPEPASPNGYLSSCGANLEPYAKGVAEWIASDAETSGNTAHVLGVEFPLSQILLTGRHYLEKEIPNLCSGCTYEEVDVTTDEIDAGTVPQKVVGFLQTHPEVNYIYNAFTGLATGLQPVLKSSGYGDVKITGCCAAGAVIQEIPEKQAAWTAAPDIFSGWVMVDTLARASVGDELSPEYLKTVELTPTWVVSTAEARESLKSTEYEWVGPGGGAYMKEFEKLWHVG